METWLGVLVVLFVLVLNFLARKRGCGSCKGCGATCNGAEATVKESRHTDSILESAATLETKT